MTDATVYASGNGEVSGGNVEPLTAPDLAVKIPGLTFSTQPVVNGGKLAIPFLAQYISAAYRYLTGISVIAAAVMIVYGGFKYIASSTASGISSGKEVITNAIIGLFLVFATYTILKVLNPAITNPGTLSVSLVGRQDSAGPSAETSRVAESATIQPTPNVETPSANSEQPNLGTPEGEPPLTTTQSTGTQPNPNIGKTIKNAKGEFVAQGTCPEDMVAIKHSDPYTAVKKTDIASFCMDKYEAPNQQGVKPLNGVTELEAEWWCTSHGKRLCTSGEWTRACLGPDGKNTYGYGSTYVKGQAYVTSATPSDTPGVFKKPMRVDKNSQPAPCNYDTPPKNPNDKLFFSLYGELYQPTHLDPTYSIFNADFLTILNKAIAAAQTAKDDKLVKRLQNASKLYPTMRAEMDRLDLAEPSGSRPTCVTAEGVFDMSGNMQEIVVKDAAAKLTSQQRIQQTAADLGQASCSSPTKYLCTKDWTWRGYFWSPAYHLGDGSTQATCEAGAGGPHAPWLYRTYENGFRCCLDLDTSNNTQPAP